MKAIVMTAAGGPGVLQLTERPLPRPGAGEVLVRVRAAGINRPDIAQRKGHYPAPPGAPADIPGLEIAGTIESLPGKSLPGKGVAEKDMTEKGPSEKGAERSSRWKAGDRVCALVSGGGYAEYCVVPEGQCLPVPENLSFTEAASLPETFFTVWSDVFDRGELQKGAAFLVHGGSGGIGITAIQLAKAWGCTVFTTAGTEEKCRFCEELGADLAVNYRTEDFEKVIRRHPAGEKGMQVILDMIGGDYTSRNLRLLADEGRLVLINVMKGRTASVDLLEVMRRRLVITGSTLRARDTAFKSAIARKLEDHVWPLLENGTVRPVVSAVFPLEEAEETHRLMESGEHRGKIVLTVGSP